MTLPEIPTPNVSPAADPEPSAKADMLRIAQMSRLFSEIHDTLEDRRAAARDATSADWQKITQKLSELQTLHVRLLHAEEAFHDKYSLENDAEVVDYDTIKREIGRALDRIRAASDTVGVSGGPEGS